MSIKIRSKEPKTYIVMGAPHSATSFISKILHENGVDMNPSDEKYYEDNQFAYFNLCMEKKNKEWPGHMKKLIRKRQKKFWGWKDPKTAFTLDKYLPHLKNDVYLICCFRKPSRVLRSWRRSRKAKEGRGLLDKYNNALLKSIKYFLEYEDK